MEIFGYLENSGIVKEYVIIDFKSFQEGFFIKIKARLTDDTLLFISEYVDSDERNYSYHLQDINNELIMRIDNAPYHTEISTFPHHIHINNSIIENILISSEEILNFIKSNLKI